MPRNTTPSDQTFSGRLVLAVRDEMRGQGITQATLAERMGVNQRYVSRRLTGAVPIDSVDLDQIAQALGVPLSALLPKPSTQERTSA